MDEIVVEGNIYVSGKFQECCIGITNGKITSVKKILKGERQLRFPHCFILPAGIDLHVHFRDPGMTHKETFATGSLSAAFGGISCVFDMPNTIPQTTTVSSFLEKKDRALSQSFVDFGIYAGVTNDNLLLLSELGEQCSGFKIYLGGTTNSLQFPVTHLKHAFEHIHRSGKPVFIHAENDLCLKKNKIQEKNLVDHLHARPSRCEKQAIDDIFFASKNTAVTKIHICHVSSDKGLVSLEHRPKFMSCGVTPHHALLNVNTSLSPETMFKVNPPLRSPVEQNRVFEAIKTGVVDILESDHAPHLLEEKNVSFEEAPSGVPGVETMFPLFLYLAKKERISFHQVIHLLCERPAEIMGIPKGKLETGRNADFIVVNPRLVKTIKAEELHSLCEWSPFEGWKALFPLHVFIRGEKIIEDQELIGVKGFGKFIGE